MVAVMQRSRRNLLIAVAVGLISDLWPIPGAMLAAVAFFLPETHCSRGALLA
jgi:hypothetical protein